MKEMYENLEWFLSVILSACSCVGMFFMGCFVRYLILDSVTVKFILIMFVVSVLLTWGMTELKNEVRYRRLLKLAEEQEFQKNEQARELYEHLAV
jgi:hypothetical protein